MNSYKKRLRWPALLMAMMLVLAACNGDDDDAGDDTGDDTDTQDTDDGDDDGDTDGDANGDANGDVDTEATASEWFDQEDFDQQLAWRDVEPEGPEGEPWQQYIEPDFVDTSEWATEGPHDICFSNAAVDNPWRQVGYTTMQEEIALHDNINDFIHVDAQGSDEAQISDIEDLLQSGDCDLLIVSPNTTAALTPAVEQACEELPVVVFDRGVNTDCTATFIQPIGGYAFGMDAAEFLIDNVEEGGNIVALRILPGVDVLEHRWAGASIQMEEAGLNVLEPHFSEGDTASVTSYIDDLIASGEQIDGVWMDAGEVGVAAAEAFENNGMEIPPITGEDQNDFLQKWNDEDLTAIAPTFPAYQWRTPIIAALQILDGEEVPSQWTLPQEPITQETLDDHLFEDMPPLFYAQCGCQDMPTFPEAWQD